MDLKKLLWHYSSRGTGFKLLGGRELLDLMGQRTIEFFQLGLK